MEMVERFCKICGSSILVSLWKIEHGCGHYCSRECASKGRTKFGTLKKKCAFCGIEFVYPKSKERRFCSRKCSALDKQRTEVRICPQCGQEFVCKPHNENKFCGYPCYGRWRSETFCGENHPRWMGGVRIREYSDLFDDNLKDMIRQRDGYKCVICDKQYKKRLLCVHHIDYDKENSHPSNLVTLCNRCHGKTGSNREYWESFFPALMAVTAVRQVSV